MEDKLEQLERLNVPAMDEILGVPFKVLDDGFVRVIDYMGTDKSIVQAARVSYGEGTKQVLRDRELIRYLLRHRHTSPFEMCEIKLHVRVPMDTWRQWIRHRTANVNEYSTRYSIAIEKAQKTGSGEWRGQGNDNRQGSGGTIPAGVGEELTRQEEEVHSLSRSIYQHRLDVGVAREQARKDLPLSTYTEAYWKMDLHNLLHFLALRMDEKAQQEIRDYANAIGREIVNRWCPLTWEAFQDYRIHGLGLSAMEVAIIQQCVSGNLQKAKNLAIEYGLLRQTESGFKSTLELREIEVKLHALKVKIPWE
ncbi:thymidylate synthase (FAD) [candidate division LCP-89 bacterium B3_LCP]|uniref:Flavin-dependent thymidylate synthase n=1 Tax=candidate division LCP-89 bacterium B3_LCP TaxID=2012998 RepID=A0A532V064_UNCL8|nr:MAG: thymidylate synthase (FAD) [candidate division LCP-89 bacterium B3_LCP]